jgi:hypothetical protein
MIMQTPAGRAILGFAAAAVAVLTFHQGMWAVLHLLNLPGLSMPPPYLVAGVPPWGVPRIINLCFWGGLYGAVFGLLFPRFTWPAWLCGLITGVIAALVGLIVVRALKGLPIGAGWEPPSRVRSFLINGSWGLGLGLIFPLFTHLLSRLRQWPA